MPKHGMLRAAPHDRCEVPGRRLRDDAPAEPGEVPAFDGIRLRLGEKRVHARHSYGSGRRPVSTSRRPSHS
jgi:hypothetical protein